MKSQSDRSSEHAGQWQSPKREIKECVEETFLEQLL